MEVSRTIKNKQRKNKNTNNIWRIEKCTQMQYRERNMNRFYTPFSFANIKYILYFLFVFLIVLDTSKNFQQKFANYTYYYCFFSFNPYQWRLTFSIFPISLPYLKIASYYLILRWTVRYLPRKTRASHYGYYYTKISLAYISIASISIATTRAK